MIAFDTNMLIRAVVADNSEQVGVGRFRDSKPPINIQYQNNRI